jgi:transposase
MYVAKGNSFLSTVSLNALEEKYAQEKKVKAKIRLQCAILRKKGKAQPYISEVTGLPVTTVSDILKRFEKRGINGCYAIKQEGQPKKLTLSQRTKLKRIILKSPLKSGIPYILWTTKLVQQFILKEFDVKYVTMQIHRLLKSMNITLQKARPEHIKANKKLQMEFKKNFDEESKFFANVDMRSYFWTKAPSNSNHTS